MQRKSRAKTLAVTFGSAAVLAAIAAPGARASGPGVLTTSPGADGRATCSAAMLRGAYGFTATGTIHGVGPVARVGRVLFDGRGHASGTATTAVNGSVFPSTFTSTYTVNPDCTGTATEVDAALGTVHDKIVIVEGGREIEAIAADQGETITATWKQQSPHR